MHRGGSSFSNSLQGVVPKETSPESTAMSAAQPCSSCAGSLDNPESDVVSLLFLDSLDTSKLKLLKSLFQMRAYRKHEVIMEAGQKLESFYVIVSGSVELGLPPNSQILEVSLDAKTMRS